MSTEAGVLEALKSPVGATSRLQDAGNISSGINRSDILETKTSDCMDSVKSTALKTYKCKEVGRCKSDDIKLALVKIQKNKANSSNLENDNAFMMDKKKLLEGKHKSRKTLNKVHKSFHMNVCHNESNLVEENRACSTSSGLAKMSELGFSIKVQRVGEQRNLPVSDETGREIILPGFFTSAASLVNPGCSLIKKAAFPKEPEEIMTLNDLYANQGSRSESMLGGLPEKHDNCNDIHSSMCQSEDNAAVDANQCKVCVADLPLNENENAVEEKTMSKNNDDSRAHCMFSSIWYNDPKSRPKKGRDSARKASKLNSLSNHSNMLEKVNKKHQNMISASARDDTKGSSLLVGRRSQAGNFVKLNLNGKGSRLRKFVNRGCKRKKTSFSKRISDRKRLKKNNDNGDVDLKETSEIFEDCANRFCNNGIDLENLTIRSQTGLHIYTNGKIQKTTHMTDPHFNQNFSDVREAAAKALGDPSDENLLSLLKVTHGFNSFLPGQLETIKRILSLQSTMLVLPTGSGKSLSYQLPALILPGTALVISPLVSLMIDQLQHLPPVISGAVLTSHQTGKEVAEVLERLRNGDLKVLFISPERLLNESFVALVEIISAISFVAVDEAHCLSEWSHNFRPSYFRLGTVLRKRLNVKCILAMTATATTKTLNSISCALDISPSDIVQIPYRRENLQLSVSSSENQLKDLLLIVKSPPFSGACSIIVYCKFQSEADTVSKFLCDNNIRAKSYHSGLSAKERKHIQEMFSLNKLPVVVATVAFGMGLDKKDVEAVIHYSLPGSLEQYVQETGRAGRDGRMAYCHLLLHEETYFKIRSLAFSDGAEEYTVNKFLAEIFASQSDCRLKLFSLNIESASRKLDLKQEVMATILLFLETEDVQYLQLLSQSNTTCTLTFYKNSPSVLSKENKWIANLIKRAQVRHGSYIFHLPQCANEMSVDIGFLLKELEKLKCIDEIKYELSDPAFVYIIKKVPENICLLAKDITTRLNEVELSKVHKVDAMYLAAVEAVNVSTKTGSNETETYSLQKSIKDYFSSEAQSSKEILNNAQDNSSFLLADIKVFLQANSNSNLTPRAVARIMHGLSSPAFPSSVWSKNHFWGRYWKVDFNVIKKAAASEMILLKSRMGACNKV